MNYKTYKSALTSQECQTMLASCKTQYDQISKDRTDLQYPTRMYPGILLSDQTAILSAMTIFAAQSAPEFGVQFDLGVGTAVSYVNAKDGESIGPHYDRPINGEADRVCSITVIAALTDGGQIKIDEAVLDMTAGEVLVLKGGTVHELLPVSGSCNLLSAFFCTNGE